MKEEVWKNIPDTDGYQVSNLGGFRRIKNGKFLKMRLAKDKYGYIRVSVYKNKSRRNLLLHRAVASLFIDNSKNLPQVNHKNAIKWDNRVENLEWCTHWQNMKHARDNGLIATPKGENVYSAKLKEKDVLDIISLLSEKRLSQYEIAKRYGVSRSTILAIHVGRSWKHLPRNH